MSASAWSGIPRSVRDGTEGRHFAVIVPHFGACKGATRAGELDTACENDDIPWCGLFAGHCVGASRPDEVLPTVVLRARVRETFGVPATPQLGAVISPLGRGQGSDLSFSRNAP